MECPRKRRFKLCKECGSIEHWMNECSKVTCKLCNQQGHIAKDCDLRKCIACKQEGHTINECKDPAYIWNKDKNCGCIEIKKDKNRRNYNTHCCKCKYFISYEELRPCRDTIHHICTRCIKDKENEVQKEKPIRIIKKDDEYNPTELLDISNTPKDEVYDDPMEIMDLNGTTSKGDVINVKIRKSCELCDRTHKSHMHVKYVKEHKYWNNEKQRIEIKGITICDVCEGKAEREIMEQLEGHKEEYCKRCNTKGSRSTMVQRLEGFNAAFYCDLNCQYANMIIYDIKSDDPRTKDNQRLEILLRRYTEGNKYAGAAYGYVTKEEILEKIYMEKVKE
jgi:hypothetical protein